MFLLHATPICCAPRTVDWNKVNNRWRGAEYYPDDPPGWEGKISSQDIRKIRKVGISINKLLTYILKWQMTSKETYYSLHTIL